MRCHEEFVCRRTSCAREDLLCEEVESGYLYFGSVRIQLGSGILDRTFSTDRRSLQNYRNSIPISPPVFASGRRHYASSDASVRFVARQCGTGCPVQSQ